LDRSFASRGRLLHHRVGDHWARIETLLRMSGNRFVAVGWATRGTSVLKRRYRFVFLLLTASGRLDPSFGNGGRRTLDSVAGQAIAAFKFGSHRLIAVGPRRRSQAEEDRLLTDPPALAEDARTERAPRSPANLNSQACAPTSAQPSALTLTELHELHRDRDPVLADQG
jgi:hypothetical protein